MQVVNGNSVTIVWFAQTPQLVFVFFRWMKTDMLYIALCTIVLFLGEYSYMSGRIIKTITKFGYEDYNWFKISLGIVKARYIYINRLCLLSLKLHIIKFVEGRCIFITKSMHTPHMYNILIAIFCFSQRGDLATKLLRQLSIMVENDKNNVITMEISRLSELRENMKCVICLSMYYNKIVCVCVYIYIYNFIFHLP